MFIFTRPLHPLLHLHIQTSIRLFVEISLNTAPCNLRKIVLSHTFFLMFVWYFWGRRNTTKRIKSHTLNSEFIVFPGLHTRKIGQNTKQETHINKTMYWIWEKSWLIRISLSSLLLIYTPGFISLHFRLHPNTVYSLLTHFIKLLSYFFLLTWNQIVANMIYI